MHMYTLLADMARLITSWSWETGSCFSCLLLSLERNFSNGNSWNERAKKMMVMVMVEYGEMDGRVGSSQSTCDHSPWGSPRPVWVLLAAHRGFEAVEGPNSGPRAWSYREKKRTNVLKPCGNARRGNFGTSWLMDSRNDGRIEGTIGRGGKGRKWERR